MGDVVEFFGCRYVDGLLLNQRKKAFDRRSKRLRETQSNFNGRAMDPPTNDVDNPEIDVDLSPEEQIDLSLRSLVEDHYNSTEISNIMI